MINRMVLRPVTNPVLLWPIRTWPQICPYSELHNGCVIGEVFLVVKSIPCKYQSKNMPFIRNLSWLPSPLHDYHVSYFLCLKSAALVVILVLIFCVLPVRPDRTCEIWLVIHEGGNPTFRPESPPLAGTLDERQGERVVLSCMQPQRSWAKLYFTSASLHLLVGSSLLIGRGEKANTPTWRSRNIVIDLHIDINCACTAVHSVRGERSDS